MSYVDDYQRIVQAEYHPQAAVTMNVAATRVAAAPASGHGTAALVLGIVGLVAWVLPIVGLPVCITGLVLGLRSLGGEHRGRAMAGVVLSIVGLVLGVINAAVGAYLGVSHALAP